MTSRFIPTDPSCALRDRTGEWVEVIRKMEPNEYGTADAGPMFYALSHDGLVFPMALDELPDLKLARYGETVFDITTVIMERLRKSLGSNDTYDSRSLFWKAHEWALEFIHSDYDDENYMTAIEEFAIAKVKDFFLEENDD